MINDPDDDRSKRAKRAMSAAVKELARRVAEIHPAQPAAGRPG